MQVYYVSYYEPYEQVLFDSIAYSTISGAIEELNARYEYSKSRAEHPQWDDEKRSFATQWGTWYIETIDVVESYADKQTFIKARYDK
jgi:hypothetical protein